MLTFALNLEGMIDNVFLTFSNRLRIEFEMYGKSLTK